MIKGGSMEGSQIMKPMSVARYDFVNTLTNLINNSQLPAFVLEAVIKDVYNDIHIISQRQLENDMKKYQEAARNAKGDNDGVHD